MKKKTLIIIASFVLLLILLLPIFINVLLRIDWFSSIVMGGESGWLSFYGSYLGGILGGLLTLAGVFLTIKYQAQIEDKKSIEKQKEIDEQNGKVIKIIDNLFNKAIVNIYYVREAVLNESISQSDFISNLEQNSQSLANVVKDLEGISWETIPPFLLQDFISIKEHLLAVNELFLGTIVHFYNSTNKVNGGLSEETLLYFLNMILTKHMNITEDKTIAELFLTELMQDNLKVGDSNK